MRKVGIEIEFAGIDTMTAAKAIALSIGGTLKHHSPHLIDIEETKLGHMRIELDTQYVHPKSDDEHEFLKDGRNLLGSAVTSLVPQELVTDPISMDQLHMLDDITNSLTAAGATGTHDSILYAFGLHLNPEIASNETSYLLAIMRTLVLYNAEVYAALSPDITRRTMGWAQAYTPEYEAHIMKPAYQPDQPTLIKDYIALNKGRNHHLDMLPIFAFLDEKLVTSLMSDALLSARPAFHFRLPNSGIGDPDWTIRDDWNLWVKIENKADELTPDDLEKWQKDNPRR